MWEALSQWPGAVAMRRSSTLYIFVNAAHILGIGIILGPILSLDARLLGLFRALPLPVIGPFLANVAKFGVVLALLTGLALFSVRPLDYLDNPAFLIKLGIVALAVANAAWINVGARWKSAVSGNEIAASLRIQAAASGALWLAALIAGRWIGFL
ncbi:MAG: DUF2214 domain-containing protein [Phyllobacteriaceae bacterium]|nr:DUF2214 domain-containing protein [Phyllobacteriaceae bacterium]